MTLLFLTSLGGAAEEVEHFDLRDRRDDVRDEFEPSRAEPVEEELSVAGAVARYRKLQRGGTPEALIECGVELLSLGQDTRKLAVEAFTRASRFEGVQAAAYFWLGEAHAADGKRRLALHFYGESVKAGASLLALERLLALQLEEGLTVEAEATADRIKQLPAAESDEQRPAE
ncbi:MAG TPA: hypothetical protein VGB98_24780 [Pyrinomonadaceae bacterium]|jgi:hypothetical protein